MASVRAFGVVGALALSSAIVVASAAPAAAAVTVTVDPSTGLADGQPVTITATGFEPGVFVGAAECGPAVTQSRDTVDCDLSNAPTTQTDSNGTAVLHLRARRVIETQNGTVDCLTTPEPCVIGAADTSQVSNPERSGGVAITFDPNAPPPPDPKLTVSPDDGLVDRQQVTVYATGFVPGEQVAIGQCAAAQLAHDECDPYLTPYWTGGIADPTGAVAAGLTVRRAVRVGTERIDCASAFAACVVVARAIGGPLGSASIGFDGSTPLPPPPTVTVEPAEGLADGQIVQVHGAGFPANVPLNIVQCPADVSPFFGCGYYSARYLNTNVDGTFSTTTKVEREAESFDPTKPGPPTDIDCAESAGRCVLWAIDFIDDLDSVNTALSFDPNAPPIPLTMNVSPSDGLVDGQAVHVTGDGFAPGNFVYIVECLAGATDANSCDITQLGGPQTDDNGHVDTTYNVRRILTLSPPVPPPPVPTTVVAAGETGEAPAAAAFFAPEPTDQTTFDCASAPGACTLTLAFLGGPEIEAVSVPLNFDASVPPNAGPPVLPVDQATGAEDAGTDDGGSGSSATTSEPAQVLGNTVSRGPLARTGTNLRDGLRVESALLILGGISIIAASELRSRARRRARGTVA